MNKTVILELNTGKILEDDKEIKDKFDNETIDIILCTGKKE